MNVGELKKALDGYDDHIEIYLSSEVDIDGWGTMKEYFEPMEDIEFDVDLDGAEETTRTYQRLIFS